MHDDTLKSPTSDRPLASHLLVAGGIALIAGELWHPEPPADPAVFLHMVRGMPAWPWLHTLQMAGLILAAVGLATRLAALSPSSSTRRASVAATLGTAVLVGALALDGYGFALLAARAASTDSDVAASAVMSFLTLQRIQAFVLAVGTLLLYGLTPLLVRAALVQAGVARGPRRMGMTLGIVAVLAGVAVLARLPLPPLPWYPLLALVFGVWSIWLGIAMRRIGAVISARLAAVPQGDGE